MFGHSRRNKWKTIASTMMITSPAGGEDREPGKDTRRRRKEDSDRAEDLRDGQRVSVKR